MRLLYVTFNLLVANNAMFISVIVSRKFSDIYAVKKEINFLLQKVVNYYKINDFGHFYVKKNKKIFKIKKKLYRG